MRMFLKHVFRSVRKSFAQSLLIVITLIVATATFVVSARSFFVIGENFEERKGANDYISDITNYYENNATEDASSLDEYAITYLELEKGDDWRAVILESAERAVTEKIIFYYIINEEGFWPSDAEYAENYERVVAEMVNTLIAYEGGNPETVSDEEYASWRKLVEDNYGEAYFRENVIYEYAIEKIVAMAKVIYK